MINFTGNWIEFLLPSRLPCTTVGFREIAHKFAIINLINCILWLWVRTPESLCRFHCLHWSLKSLFQILAFRHFLSDPLLFTYYVPKPPCQCNWKQARRRLDGSDEWKCDLDPSTHNPLAGVQAGLMGMKSNSHLMAGQWPVRRELGVCSLAAHGQVFMSQLPPGGTSPGPGWIRDDNAVLCLSSGACPFVSWANTGVGFGFKASEWGMWVWTSNQVL